MEKTWGREETGFRSESGNWIHLKGVVFEGGGPRRIPRETPRRLRKGRRKP